MAAGTRPAMLWAHDQSRVVGHWSAISDDGRGLLVRGQLNLKTTEGREAFASVEAGDLDGLSIGFFVPPNGSKYQAGANLLTEIELHEISLVSCPANQAARITSVKSLPAKPKTLREFEAALRELGFSRAEAVAVAKNGFTEAEKAEEADLVNQLAELIKLI
jgi:HK97 family phage prohead protease